MIKVEITANNFVYGIKRVPKGEILEVAPPIAKYIVKTGGGVIVGDTITDEAPPPAKKRVYKRRDMKADA